MTCEELVAALSAYIDGELDEETRAAAEEHLATCRKCPIALRTTEATIALYRSALRGGVGAERRARLLERIRAGGGA